MERYIYAVVRKLPAKSREDVSQELKTLIEDMLEERCGDIKPTDHDLKVIIAELGTPSELAQKYQPEGTKSALISEPYYSRYVFVLKLALICVLTAVSVGFCVTAWKEVETSEALPWFMYVWNWLGSSAAAGISVVGIVTIIFSVLEYKNVSFDGGDLSDLPAVPKKFKGTGKTPAVIGIVVSVFFTVTLLFFPEAFCFIVDNGKGIFPVFDAPYIRSMALLIFVFGILGVARGILTLLDEAHPSFILYSAGIDVMSIPLVVFLFGKGEIMNHYGIRMYIKEVIGYSVEADVAAQVLCNLNYVICGALIFCFAVSCITTVMKYINLKKEK